MLLLYSNKSQARLKSTLKYLNLGSFAVGKVHRLWSSAKYKSHGVQKAFVHVKMSMGTCILQSNRARLTSSWSLAVLLIEEDDKQQEV